MKKLILSTLLLSLLIKSVYSSTLCYQFTGLNAALIENINIKLMLDKKNCKNDLAAKQIPHIYLHSLTEIKKAIEPFGYFRAHIYSKLVKSDIKWLAILNISLGPAIKIRELEVKITGPGKNNPKIQQFVTKFPIQTGDSFNTIRYTQAKNKLQNRARNQGYIENYLNNSLILNLIAYKALIKFWLITGERFYFGDIQYHTRIYSNDFLDRIITFKPSQPYSPKKILNLQREMEASYYFKRVIITPDYTHIKNHHVPLNILYEVPKAHAYRIGMGYGTLTGARLSAALSLRRLTNTGNHIEAEIQSSSVQSKINGTYFIPGKNPLMDQWLFGLQGKIFNPNNAKSKSGTIFGAYTTKHNHFQYTTHLNFLFERFRIYHNIPQKTHELYPNFNIVYLKADDLVNPRHAINFLFNIKAAHTALLSINSFIQSDLQIKYIVSPFTFSRFIFRTNAGAVLVKNLKTFPLTLRFFAGGLQSLRGFGDSSIGPGRYLLVASGEYQHKITGPWNAAIFYDLGKATNDFHEPFHRGSGIGIVYNSVVGSIKVYLARALSKSTRPWSVEFSIGPEFS